jgi:hypothetical protein
MRRQIIILAAVLVTVAAGASAQILRPPLPTDCPPPDSITCQLWPHLCEDCEYLPPVRLVPVEPLFPRRIGVVALAQDGGFNGIWRNPSGWPNWIAADEVVGYGIQAIQLWPMVGITDEDGWPPLDGLDMTYVYENDGLDLVILRPMQHSFSEKACADGDSATWEGGDWGAYAEALYAKFGHLPKVIILTNWESDWQLWGPLCREPNECPVGGIWPVEWQWKYNTCEGDYDCQVRVCDMVRWNRAWYLTQLFEARQAGIEAARAAHPDAALRVFHMVTVNHTEDTVQLNVTRDVIPALEHKPDLIGLSHWDKDQTVVEALNYIRVHTGFPRNRIMLSETGEPSGDTQYQAIYTDVSAAMDWGAASALVWTWRQHWDGKDMALVDDDGVPNEGLAAVLELREKYDGR